VRFKPFSRLAMVSRVSAPLLALAAGLAVAIALASCGGEDAKLLPGNTAREIDENLDAVRRLAEDGECIEAEDAALQVSTQVEALSGIDPKLKEALRNGAARLNEVVSTCVETTEGTVEEETAPTTTETTEERAGKGKGQKKSEPEEGGAEEEREAKPPTEAPSSGEAKGNEGEPEPAEEEGGQSGGIGPGSAAGSG
jgi:hypothetical protein